jgi:hypothetical protein
MKYIFVAGAPGSKWSSVVKNIYHSPSVDRSDHSLERTYFHDATGRTELMHMGAYFDPGMEFGDWFLNYPGLGQRSKQEHELEFDRPFTGKGIRIIKSHWFSYTQHIEFIKNTWPECPVVLVHRPDDACLGWWVKCGEFQISYPLYRDYYKDLRQMSAAIAKENEGNRRAARDYPGYEVETNRQLARTLNIAVPAEMYYQDYILSDIKVTVI